MELEPSFGVSSLSERFHRQKTVHIWHLCDIKLRPFRGIIRLTGSSHHEITICQGSRPGKDQNVSHAMLEQLLHGEIIKVWQQSKCMFKKPSTSPDLYLGLGGLDFGGLSFPVHWIKDQIEVYHHELNTVIFSNILPWFGIKSWNQIWIANKI